MGWGELSRRSEEHQKELYERYRLDAQAGKRFLGKASWIWREDVQHHIAVCSAMSKGKFKVGELYVPCLRTLTDDQIVEGKCDRHV